MAEWRKIFKVHFNTLRPSDTVNYAILVSDNISSPVWLNQHCPWWRHQMEKKSALLALCAGNSPMFSLICAWINAWVNNRKAGGLSRHRAHYDAIVMFMLNRPLGNTFWWNLKQNTLFSLQRTVSSANLRFQCVKCIDVAFRRPADIFISADGSIESKTKQSCLYDWDNFLMYSHVWLYTDWIRQRHSVGNSAHSNVIEMQRSLSLTFTIPMVKCTQYPQKSVTDKYLHCLVNIIIGQFVWYADPVLVV